MAASKTSPTQRTLAALRKDGAIAGVVERWNMHAKIRQDLFGFIDIVAIRDGKIVAVQCTSTSNMSSREKKIVENCAEPAKAWLRAGGVIEVWGWAKRGPAGKRKLWTSRIVPITPDLFGIEPPVVEVARTKRMPTISPFHGMSMDALL